MNEACKSMIAEYQRPVYVSFGGVKQYVQRFYTA